MDAHAGVPEYRSGLGLSLLEIGLSLRAQGQVARAERACQKAHEVFTRLATENPRVTEYQSGLARSSIAVASFKTGPDQLEEGVCNWARGPGSSSTISSE